VGHGTTPCPRMMKTLRVSQNQGISYEVTHNHLSRFLWAHDFHNGTIKRLQRHRHLVQLLPRIQVQVTLHQQYIRVHLEGLINGVCLLLHQLSHHHRIFCCKPWPLHPYTPWSQQFFWENWEVQQKARYHFLEGICEEFLHTFHMKICTHKTHLGWNYYVVVF
jgi:hypothetical protein